MTTTGGPDDHGAQGADPDAVEQLQRAVLTAIGAARVALDALESVVADRRRLDDLAASGRDLVGSVWNAVFSRSDDDESEGPSRSKA
jgi:hypothetical protein